MKFVFDECVSFKIAKALRSLGKDADPYFERWEKGAADLVWIPAAGRAGWCVVTSDYFRKPQEREALRRNSGRVILLAIKSLGFWEQVRLVINRWEAIETVVRKESPPYIYRFTRRRTRPQRIDV